MKTTTIVGLKGTMFYHGRFLDLVDADMWRSILKINFVFMNLWSNCESKSGSPKLDKEHISSSEIYFARLQRKVRVKISKVITDCSPPSHQLFASTGRRWEVEKGSWTWKRLRRTPQPGRGPTWTTSTLRNCWWGGSWRTDPPPRLPGTNPVTIVSNGMAGGADLINQGLAFIALVIQIPAVTALPGTRRKQQ